MANQPNLRCFIVNKRKVLLRVNLPLRSDQSCSMIPCLLRATIPELQGKADQKFLLYKPFQTINARPSSLTPHFVKFEENNRVQLKDHVKKLAVSATPTRDMVFQVVVLITDGTFSLPNDLKVANALPQKSQLTNRPYRTPFALLLSSR
jgi:hypothetical protein